MWSDTEVKALIAASEKLARKPEARQDYSPVIRTALCTGLRLGELLGLQWQDVDLDQKTIKVTRQWTRLAEYAEPKTTAAVREVPLPDKLVGITSRGWNLKSAHSLPEDPVFAGKEDGRWAPERHRPH